MKKIMILVGFLLVINQLVFSKKLPILDRLSNSDYYPVSSIVLLAEGSSMKSIAFREIFLSRIVDEYRIGGREFVEPLKISDIRNLCENLYIEEIHLKARLDKNSLWDTETQTIDFFIESTNYDGPGWVYHDYKNDIHFPFIKGNCLNFILVTENNYVLDSSKPKESTTTTIQKNKENQQAGGKVTSGKTYNSGSKEFSNTTIQKNKENQQVRGKLVGHKVNNAFHPVYGAYHPVASYHRVYGCYYGR